MAIDGILIHHLVNEFRPLLINGRINKIIQSNQTDIVFQIHNFKTYNLLISMSYTAPRVLISLEKPYAPLNPFNLCMVFRKYLDRGIIRNIEQIDNDRIIVFHIEAKNEMGDTILYKLIVEIMGRSSNLILTNESYTIIEVMKKHFPSIQETSRIMIPKAQYEFPSKRGLINPFKITDEANLDISLLEGVAKYHQVEINYLNSLKSFLDKPIKPTIIEVENKKIFTPYNLESIDGNRTHFENISLMLEKYFEQNSKNENPFYSTIQKIVSRKISLLYTKIDNLNNDLENANSHLDDLIKGQLIQTYLYKIKKGMTEITLPSFDNTTFFNISLDPKKSPTDNMQKYFKNYKKSISANHHINKQLEITRNEISYLETILSQLEFVNHQELQEIKQELIQHSIIKDDKKNKIKTNSLKAITKYETEDAKFYVGKNNLQNNFLTHQFARKNDYWFHVKDMPSAHIILQTNNLNERNIRIAAHLAALNSKYEKSSSVAVDYTLIKNIKKIPNRPGCFVTYTDQKTIYIDPSLDDLHKLLKNQ
ncbi:MAG: NFACT family protein [Bacilli bacterium]|nr:NFACT family protein [Bacilli bacterium]